MITKDNLEKKYRCWKCGSLLFVGTLSGKYKIEIVCKNRRKNKDGKSIKCKENTIFSN